MLKSALQTVVSQDFTDYEVVVSDNNSRDETREVIEGFMQSSDRVRYVNPGRDLSMCDNFEYVLTHATGEYILYLSDDDALAAGALSYIHELLTRLPINTMVWERGYYQHPDIPDDNLRCTFVYGRRSGNLYEVSTRSMADAFADFNSKTYGLLPKMINCVAARSVVLACREKTQYFSLPPFPDYSAACHLLGINDTYHVLDLPLYICGVSKVSNAGIQYNRQEKFDDHINLVGQDMLEGVPYPMRYLNASYFLATYNMFQKIYPEVFTKTPNMDAYFKSHVGELMFYEEYEDVSEELQTLAGYMRDFYGSDERFNALLREGRASKAAAAGGEKGADSLGSSLRLIAGKIVRSNDFLHTVARGVKRRLRPAAAPAEAPQPAEDSSARYVSRANIQTISDASQILGGFLSAEAKSPAQLHPIRVEPLSLIEGA